MFQLLEWKERHPKLWHFFIGIIATLGVIAVILWCLGVLTETLHYIYDLIWGFFGPKYEVIEIVPIPEGGIPD